MGAGFIFRFFDDKIKINEELERDFMKARKVRIFSNDPGPNLIL
jgi:hypothetical protein